MANRFGTTGIDNLVGTTDPDAFFMTADNYVTDSIDGGRGNDTVNYGASHVGVKVTLTDATTAGGASGGTVEADFAMSLINPSTGDIFHFNHHQIVANLTSIENATGSNYDDTLTGNSGNNVLNGLGGNDIIDGGAGVDTITGGSGRDLMTGGSGHDTFVFNHASDTPMAATTYYDFDRITDFVRGEDKIDLHNLVNETAGHHALSFIGTSGFSGVAGEVASYFTGSLGHMVAIDLDGDKHVDMQFLVGSTTLDEMHAHLQLSDFILA
jgi:Ca2+-binding RTX toxin-like protein